MKIKLIAVDMDGTVLRSDRTISGRTVSALQKAMKCGCIVVPASGRVANNLPKQMVSIPGIRYAVTSNGASVVNLRDKTSVYTDLIEAETSCRLLNGLLSAGYFPEAYCGGVSYSDRSALNGLIRLEPSKDLLEFIKNSQIFVDNLAEYFASRNLRLEKINLPLLPRGEADGLHYELEETGKFTLCSSFPGNIEINRVGCSKGKALEHLCGLLKIRREEVLTIGDSGNDVEMLRFAGVGVAMRNATPEARAAADCSTASNDEDGVALAIEKFALA